MAEGKFLEHSMRVTEINLNNMCKLHSLYDAFSMVLTQQYANAVRIIYTIPHISTRIIRQ